VRLLPYRRVILWTCSAGAFQRKTGPLRRRMIDGMSLRSLSPRRNDPIYMR